VNSVQNIISRDRPTNESQREFKEEFV
jgi:hypothetical protein